jgi:hypothetical protein
MLTFPIDAIPVSGKFIGGYFHPDTPEGTADVFPMMNHLGKTGCFEATSELCLYEL